MFSRFKDSIRNISPYILNKLNKKTLAKGFAWTATQMGLDFAVPYIFGQTVSLLASRASSAVLFGIEMGPWTMIATGATAYVVRVAVIDTRNNTYVPIGPRAFQKAICDFTKEAVNRPLEKKSKPGEDLIILQKGVIGVSSISSLVCTQFIPVVGSTLSSAGMLGWKYGPQFGGCLVAAVVACTFYNTRSAKTIIDLRAKSLEIGNKSFDDLMVAINHPITIQSSLKEEFEQKKIRKSQQAYADIETKSAEFLNITARRQNVFQGLIFALMNLLAGKGVLNGELSAGDFATIQALSMQFFSGLGAFGQAVSQVVSAGRDSKVFFDYINTPSPIKDRYPTVKLDIPKGGAGVEFKNISFFYQSKPDAKVLTDVSCQIKPGMKIGFVGASGSGKSTAGKLLFRFMDPVSGEILINGKNISEVSLKSLRSSIGIIEQNPVLLGGTLLENILYGAIASPGTPEEAVHNVLEAASLDLKDIAIEESAAQPKKDSKEEVKISIAPTRRIYQFAEGSREKKLIDNVLSAAQNAHLTDFINRDKYGLLMMVEERGANLSGGQIQRVAIARVLMRGENLKILLLDEATSALDAKTEAQVQENIDEIGKKLGLTQIWITHHLINLVNANENYVFDQGRIIQHGSHDKLISQDGIYAKLWADQSIDKKEDKISPPAKQVGFTYQSSKHYRFFDVEPKQKDPSDSVVIWHHAGMRKSKL